MSPEPDVYVAGKRLQVVSDFKYLGIFIDSNLSFKQLVKRVKCLKSLPREFLIYKRWSNHAG